MQRKTLIVALLLVGGCGPFRRAKTPPPPGPTPARIPDQVTSLEPAPAPQNLPPPPAIGSGTVAAKPTETKAVGLPKTPDAAPPVVERPMPPPVKKPPAAPPVVAAVPETVEPPAPTYRLGELRTADEKEKLRRQTEQLIAQCTAALAATEGRSLTPTQTEMVSRVRIFAQQAKDSLEKDPGEAKNFAAKGRTFAEALLAELR
jgi:hypothetical protein